MTLQITAAEADPALMLLPWGVPLAQWPDDLTVALPRGISRNVVRFVQVDRHVYAIKETPTRAARREYRLLGLLAKDELPVVEAVGVVTGRTEPDGAELPAALITKHLRFSLPYRALFAACPDQATADRLIDALVVLLVRLHLAGFMWGDCSLSNTLFRRDAGLFEAYLVDAETGERHEKLSDGQRLWDIELATDKCAGELMDLQAGGLLGDLDPIDIAGQIGERYRQLWGLLTTEVRFADDELWRMHERSAQLHAIGFDIAEVSMTRAPDEQGHVIVMRPLVVEAGHHRKRLVRLTGLQAGENQARRLLAGFDEFRARVVPDLDESEAAALWMAQRYQPLVAAVPPHLRGRLEFAEVFHEVMEHRWYLCQQENRDVSWDDAAQRYIGEVLAAKPDEALITPVEDAIPPLSDKV